MISVSVTFSVVVLFLTQYVEPETCGRRSTTALELVSYGSQSRLGEWPWHAAILHRVDQALPSYACGGTILSRSYVVTAAHCTWTESKIRPLTISEMLVLAGITDIQRLQPSMRQMSVARIERHQDYNTGTLENDIALLVLVGELEFTDYVKPVCLRKGGEGEETIVGKQGFVAGWGKDQNSLFPDSLKHVVMPIVSREDCRAKDTEYYTRYLFDGKAFCAGYGNGSSVNAGDSGSGLFIELDGDWQLQGIVSNGKINATTRQLDTESFIVFTHVGYFHTWIQSIMGPRPQSVQEIENCAVCGKKKEPKFKRTGSKEERKWPWQGQVYRTKKCLCEVVIISESFLLSPADVYSGKDVRDPVNLRAVFRNGTGYALANYRIGRVLRHENYTRESKLNNIALLKLVMKITFTIHLRPICLWSIESNVENVVAHAGDYSPLLNNYERCSSTDIVENTFCYIQNSHNIKSDFVYIRHNGTWFLRGVLINVSPHRRGWFKVTMLDVLHFKEWIETKQTNPISDTKSHNLLALNCTQSRLNDATLRVFVSGSFKCFATLITPSLLITTGSCVDHSPVESIGLFIRIKIEPVRSIHLHPHFDNRRLTNNIGLIEHHVPIAKDLTCLPTFSEHLSNFQLQIPSGGPKLNPVNLTMTNVQTCANRWHSEGIQVAIDGSHICAKLSNLEKVVKLQSKDCRSPKNGMPLAYESNGRYYLRGILDIAMVNRCENLGLSEVFIDVLFYDNWIGDVAANYSSQSVVTLPGDEDDGRPVWWRQ